VRTYTLLNREQTIQEQTKQQINKQKKTNITNGEATSRFTESFEKEFYFLEEEEEERKEESSALGI